MFPALIALNLVLWITVLAYALRLVPPVKRFWRGWAALLSITAAIAVSVGSYRLGRREQTRRIFEQHYAAGIDERSRGNLEEAEKELEAAQGIQPGNPDVRQQLADLKQQKPAEKRVQVKEARVDPSVPRQPPQERPTQATSPPPNAPAAGVPADQRKPGARPKPVAHKPSPFEIQDYAIDVRLDPKAHTLSAIATIQVHSRGEAVPRLDFSLNPECLPSTITLDGATVRFTHTNDLLSISPARPLPAGGRATVVVSYRREGDAIVGKGEALISPEGCYFLTEARWYPSTGELDFRAPVRVRAHVPPGYTAVSLGALKSTRKDAEGTTFEWGTTRLASMVSLAAARYVQQSVQIPVPGSTPGERASVLPITCYTFERHRDRAPAFLKEAASIVRFYQKRFGAYPYERLEIAEIPLFPGGYGSTSLVMLIDKSFEEKKVDREFVAHEIAHQWWGNSVFPQGLGAAWLSEAFANYSAWMYDASINGNPRVLRKRVERASAEYFREAAAKGDQPIAETDPYQQIGAREQIIYEKGAVVLHMLRREMGDAAFFHLMRHFADRYRFGKAKIEDFRAVADQENGKPLGWFFDQWLGRTGGLELSYSFDTVPESTAQDQLALTVDQPAPGYRAKMKVRIGIGDRAEDHVIELTGPHDEIRIPVKGRVSSILFDPDNDYLMKPPQWVVKERPRPSP